MSTTTAVRHSVDDQSWTRLETALRDRDDELRDLRQTMDLNERALLRSLEDERRRWATDRQRLQSEILSARRYGFSAFRSPSADQALPGDRVQTAAIVVVEPSQRPPPTVSRSSSETAATGWDTVSSVDKSENRIADTGNCDTITPSEILFPVKTGSGNISSDTGKNDFELGRQTSRAEVGGDAGEKLRVELELCRQEFADERRRWANEKRVVVEYQLRLQTYCRQLADRNQRLEEQLKTMSLELGRNCGSSGYSSDSAALVAQFLDDNNLLTSSL